MKENIQIGPKALTIYVGLVHAPVVNKRGQEVITSITNLDIHDIARSCRTFGVEKFFLINPLYAQQTLAQRILAYWQQDQGNAYNPDRSDALKKVVWAFTIEEAVAAIKEEQGESPAIVVTSAQFAENTVAAADLPSLAAPRPILLLFGTGWGLAPSVSEAADWRLQPITYPTSGYNHLSVRSAVAIYLDRIRQGR
ncbi:MAG: RNA methyltransferase [Bacteriovoracaceae bacterium]|nr:RNA methyltransferase [Bacteriovoracaceae bacterium]